MIHTPAIHRHASCRVHRPNSVPTPATPCVKTSWMAQTVVVEAPVIMGLAQARVLAARYLAGSTTTERSSLPWCRRSVVSSCCSSSAAVCAPFDGERGPKEERLLHHQWVREEAGMVLPYLQDIRVKGMARPRPSSSRGDILIRRRRPTGLERVCGMLSTHSVLGYTYNDLHEH
jgi:hypothetical protein